ncbi:MAG: restriction endonuclease subunit S [Cyanobacteria bacterium P01_F01_bin.143]
MTSGSRDWKKYYSDYGAYFIRTQDIKTNKLELDNAAHVDLPKNVEGKRSLVEKGDLLMTITGANVGKVAIVDQKIPEAYISQSVALMKPIDPEITPYLHYYFQSDSFGSKMINELVYGVGRPVLSLENMREVAVALPCLEEQKVIVSELELKFSTIEKIENELISAVNKAEMLRQSILKKAFSGQLVKQNNEEEPAFKLLMRVQAEKQIHLELKKIQKSKTQKNKKPMNTESPDILDILKKAKGPMSAVEVWQESKHRDSIESFYAELKTIQSKISETRKETESFLELINED